MCRFRHALWALTFIRRRADVSRRKGGPTLFTLAASAEHWVGGMVSVTLSRSWRQLAATFFQFDISEFRYVEWGVRTFLPRHKNDKGDHHNEVRWILRYMLMRPQSMTAKY